MDTKKDIDTTDTKVTRRDFLYLTTGSFTAVGAGALAWPFITQMNPDASVKALASTEVDLSPIMPGQSITILWRGKPVFVRRRTEEEIAEAQAVEQIDLPDPETDETRVQKPEWLVMVGVCTHLGCIPLGNNYDTSGRIRKGPAPKNLEIPSYVFLDDNTIKIG